jgi:hypothetical protein
MKTEIHLNEKCTAVLSSLDAGARAVEGLDPGSLKLGDLTILNNRVTLDLRGASELRAALGALIESFHQESK